MEVIAQFLLRPWWTLATKHAKWRTITCFAQFSMAPFPVQGSCSESCVRSHSISFSFFSFHQLPALLPRWYMRGLSASCDSPPSLSVLWLSLGAGTIHPCHFSFVTFLFFSLSRASNHELSTSFSLPSVWVFWNPCHGAAGSILGREPS